MKKISLIVFLVSINLIAAAQDTSKVKTEEPILDFAEVNPAYPGGEEAMIKFIQSTVIYPEFSKEMGEQGTVYVQFVVNTDGTLTDVVVMKGVSASLNAEAIRVIKLMPNWTPGMQAEKIVRVKYTIPIAFLIDNGKKKKKQ